jgi:hypothetical protein
MQREGHQLIGNQVFRLAEEGKKREEVRSLEEISKNLLGNLNHKFSSR